MRARFLPRWTMTRRNTAAPALLIPLKNAVLRSCMPYSLLKSTITSAQMSVNAPPFSVLT
jgi:hypothetical protein